MATTWLKALHTGKGKSMLAALGERTGYATDPEKTEGGELASAYECDPRTAASEFLLSKRQYAQATGRDQGKRDVIAYHIRQSFSSGEVDAETANAIGYELAMAFTKGKHQFIVATHTNTDCVHSHIIFNSTDLNCTHKFADFKYSAIALRRISDRICLEHGLSIIEKPGVSKGKNYAEWLGEKKPPSNRDALRGLIDQSLSAGMSYTKFLAALQAVGVEVKQGANLSLKPPGAKRFIRCKTLGDGYSEDALLKRLAGEMKIPIATVPEKRVSLLIDIQAKIQQAHSGGYERWAKLFNLKEAAKTLIYLQENNLTDYTDLEKQAAAATEHFHQLSDEIKLVENRMKEISELQKHMGSYRRTREVYTKYRQAGYSKKFRAEHEADILLHQAAKKYFDGLGLKKLPNFQSLKQEYATLTAKKNKLYGEYRTAKGNMKTVLTIQANTDRILNIPPTAKTRETLR